MPEISINCASSKILVCWVPESEAKNIPVRQNKHHQFLSCSALPFITVSALEKVPLRGPGRRGYANPAQAHKLKWNTELCLTSEKSERMLELALHFASWCSQVTSEQGHREWRDRDQQRLVAQAEGDEEDPMLRQKWGCHSQSDCSYCETELDLWRAGTCRSSGYVDRPNTEISCLDQKRRSSLDWKKSCTVLQCAKRSKSQRQNLQRHLSSLSNSHIGKPAVAKKKQTM